MISTKRSVLFQVLLLRVAFAFAMMTQEESLKCDIVIIDVDVFNAEGMTMGDCHRELEKYPGVVVRKQWEIGDRFKGFLIEDPQNQKDQVSHFSIYERCELSLYS